VTGRDGAGRDRPTVDHLGRPTNEAGAELRETGQDPSQRTFLESAAQWFDERTGTAHLVRTTLRKVFPDHWSFLLGEVALFCFVILLATGTFLTFFYVPSGQPVIYAGSYEPLQGATVSAAYDSVMKLSFEVRAGLLMRQVHHWTAVIFVAVIVTHLARTFFTGAFRRPRELNWILGFGLLLFALAEGITGYSLPDDLLSGTGARIFYSAAISIPFVGPYVASLAFGGEFPTTAFISRFFVLHVMLLPGLFIATIGAHVGLVFLQKHTQFRGSLQREDNVVGRHFWPGQAFLSGGLFFLTAAAMSVIGGLVQINPIWSYGPFEPAVVSSPAQPDWYVGWLDGALRIFPSFEPTILGITIPSVFLPGIVLPGVLFTIVALWPWIDRRLTGDRGVHHLLDWPWEQPARAAAGAAILTIFAVLTLAGGNDVIAVFLDLRVETLTVIFQVLVIVLPIVVAIVTYALCRARLRRPAPDELVPRDAASGDSAGGGGSRAPRHAGVAIRRTADGGFEEVEA
jgi:ubiquinol-cytochrome c reductase cytochrome b subunit